jgi:hypothetical protein
MQAVAPTVAAGWGGMLGGWVGGSYQRVRRFIADHRKGTYAAHYIVVFDVYKSITNTTCRVAVPGGDGWCGRLCGLSGGARLPRAPGSLPPPPAVPPSCKRPTRELRPSRLLLLRWWWLVAGGWWWRLVVVLIGAGRSGCVGRSSPHRARAPAPWAPSCSSSTTPSYVSYPSPPPPNYASGTQPSPPPPPHFMSAVPCRVVATAWHGRTRAVASSSRVCRACAVCVSCVAAVRTVRSLQQAPKDGQDRYALWDHCKTQSTTHQRITPPPTHHATATATASVHATTVAWLLPSSTHWVPIRPRCCCRRQAGSADRVCVCRMSCVCGGRTAYARLVVGVYGVVLLSTFLRVQVCPPSLKHLAPFAFLRGGGGCLIYRVVGRVVPAGWVGHDVAATHMRR